MFLFLSSTFAAVHGTAFTNKSITDLVREERECTMLVWLKWAQITDNLVVVKPSSVKHLMTILRCFPHVSTSQCT